MQVREKLSGTAEGFEASSLCGRCPVTGKPSSLMLNITNIDSQSLSSKVLLLIYIKASMEKATDGAETAAIDGLVSSSSENISVSFCLRAPGYGFDSVMCPQYSSGGRNTSASVTVNLTNSMII